MRSLRRTTATRITASTRPPGAIRKALISLVGAVTAVVVLLVVAAAWVRTATRPNGDRPLSSRLHRLAAAVLLISLPAAVPAAPWLGASKDRERGWAVWIPVAALCVTGSLLLWGVAAGWVDRRAAARRDAELGIPAYPHSVHPRWIVAGWLLLGAVAGAVSAGGFVLLAAGGIHTATGAGEVTRSALGIYLGGVLAGAIIGVLRAHRGARRQIRAEASYTAQAALTASDRQPGQSH